MSAIAETSVTAASGLTPSRRLLLIASLFGGIFIGTFDQTFVVTILPQMMSDLEISAGRIGDATWIINGYLLGYVLALPTLGRAADVHGRVKIYIVASTVFAVGTAAVALAPNLAFLTAARAVSAVGGGALIPIGLAIASDVVSERRRPLILALLLAGENASSLLGPIWGAGLESVIGWRAIFWLNIPLLIPCVAGVIAFGRIKREPAPGGVDPPGIALFVVALVGLIGILWVNPASPNSVAISLTLGAIGAAAAIGLWWWERRARYPMIDMSLFKQAPVTAANVAYLLIGAALMVALVTVPLMQNTLYGGSTFDGAIAICGLLIALPLGGIIGGWLASQIGYRATAFGGLCLAIGGFVWMMAWRDVISPIEMWPALFCIGGGLGLCDAPLVTTVVEHAKESQRGSATGVILVNWTVGMILGLVLLGSRGLSRFEERAAELFEEFGLAAGTPEYLDAIHRTYNEVLLITAGALVIAALASLFLRRGDRREGRWLRVPGLL